MFIIIDKKIHIPDNILSELVKVSVCNKTLNYWIFETDILSKSVEAYLGGETVGKMIIFLNEMRMISSNVSRTTINKREDLRDIVWDEDLSLMEPINKDPSELKIMLFPNCDDYFERKIWDTVAML